MNKILIRMKFKGYLILFILIAAAFTSNAQNNEIQVTGIVKDEVAGLPGITVFLKNDPKRVVITDMQGRYNIKVPSNGTLTFRAVGYHTQDIDIRGETTVNVILKSSLTDLDEVAVIAYGTQKKASVVGAISTIDVQQLKVPVRSLNNVLAGKVAGVIGIQRSGEPGFDDASFWIRGIGTFGAGRNPLILVDGIERPLSNIEPEEIASFSVLKDAAATAVYGVRGANGAVLVTTRRGVNAKPTISFKHERGIVGATKLPEFVDGPTYAELFNEAVVASNPLSKPVYSAETIQKFRDGSDPYLYPNVNWIKSLYKDWTNNNRTNLNISGGSQSAKYFVSASMYEENGIYNVNSLEEYNTNINLKRYNFRANTDIDLNKNALLSLGIAGILMNSSYPGNSASTIWDWTLKTSPIAFPIEYPGGLIASPEDGGSSNPYDVLTRQGFQTRWNNTIQSNIGLQYNLSGLVKGLKAQAKFSFDANNFHNIQRTKNVDTWRAIGRDPEGELILQQVRLGTTFLGFARQSSGDRRMYAETTLNYDRTFGDHAVGGLLLFNRDEYLDANQNSSITALPYRHQGISGRSTYGYKNKYFAEFNFGYNGSENFAKGSRYGFFPSIAAGYIVSEEPFFKNNVGFIEFLKLRVSHGLAGNDNIGGRRFAYITTVGTGNGGYAFGTNNDNNVGGRGEDQWGVNLTWEKSARTNLGIETKFLKGASIQVDFFQEKRTEILLTRQSLPYFMGLRNNPLANLGTMENKGFDASLEYSKQFNDFGFSFKGNFTYATNKRTNIDQPDYSFPYQNVTNTRFGEERGLIASGLFKDQDDIDNSPKQFGTVRPGDIKYRDLNSDGVIDGYDVIPLGNAYSPEIVYGFGTSVNYKGIDLSLFFQGIDRVKMMLSGNGFYPFSEGGSIGSVYVQALDRWTPENQNQNAYFPRLSNGQNINNYQSSTFWQKDGSFIRLKTAELGYTLPKRLTSSLKVNTVRLYASGFNLLTWSSFKLWDPELGGGRGGQYPTQRTISFGVNVNFN